MALASAWGGKDPDFERVEGELDVVEPIPPYESVIHRIEKNPDLERWVTELERRRALLELERARRTPDLTLSGGFQRIRQDDQNVWTVGLGIPLPIFDRNQGGVREANALVEKANEESRLAQATVRRQLADEYASLSASHREATTLRIEVLPRADQAYGAAKAGYEQGKFNYLDVLDAQRTLFEVRGQYIASLTGYHLARASVERLIGESLSEISVPASPVSTPPPLGAYDAPDSDDLKGSSR
jgi:cobalt-zinc-cadmium efflux system outer membrane protein